MKLAGQKSHSFMGFIVLNFQVITHSLATMKWRPITSRFHFK